MGFDDLPVTARPPLVFVRDLISAFLILKILLILSSS